MKKCEAHTDSQYLLVASQVAHCIIGLGKGDCNNLETLKGYKGSESFSEDIDNEEAEMCIYHFVYSLLLYISREFIGGSESKSSS